MRGTITSAITLSDANLPKGRETKQISFFVTGDYGITVPAYWNKVGGTYDGTKRCEYRIRCVNGNNTFQDVSYSIYVDGVVGGTVTPIVITPESIGIIELKTEVKDNILWKDNTEAFIPDADYEPATKKYVDDNTNGNIDGGSAITIYLTTQKVSGGTSI